MAQMNVSLKAARELRDNARKQVAEGIDPAEQKKRKKHAAKTRVASSFSAVARSCIDRQS